MHEIGRPGSAHHYCMRCADEWQQNADRNLLKHGTALIAIACLSALSLGLLLVMPSMNHWGLNNGIGSSIWQNVGLAACLMIGATAMLAWFQRRSHPRYRTMVELRSSSERRPQVPRD
jgi:hypothetical protein